MPKELLLEIGSEEIPAGFIPPALAALRELAVKALTDARLTFGEVHTMGNPRRLALHVADVSDRQPDSVRTVTGPPKKAAYDGAGNPTKAAVGFAKGQGVEVSALTVQSTDKGDYIAAVIQETGLDSTDALAGILPGLILSIPFPKTMRWMDRDVRFARPIHWILAILGGETIHFEIDGIKSGNLSRGHRFMSPGAFRVKDYASYMQQTKDNYTIVDMHARLEMARSLIKETADSIGATVLSDEGLLQEVSCLVEYPVTVLGGFDKEYLSLPKEVLVHAMREHQRYFALTDGTGSLKNFFITVSNTRARDMETVRSGNERVLRARLSDARFFYDEDMKHTLDDRVEGLKKVVFQEKLGTVHDKVQRVTRLAEYVADTLYKDHEVTKSAKRAAHLCKADLATSMVYEFASLQGVMGGEYARRQGESEDVARAITEHYMPRFSGDSVPASKAGTAVSVADKMDTIAGIFSAGKPPTGSEDPYALRRQALGIIAIIYSGGHAVSLKSLIGKAVGLLKVKGVADALESDILDFFRQRAANQLTTEGFEYDTVDAVLAREFDDIIDARERVKALSEFRKAEGFAPFIIAFKRVANIIPEGYTGTLDEGLLKETAEKELFAAYDGIKDDVASMLTGKRYKDALERIAGIRPAVDKLFDDVMVMDKDEAVKNNRLALLSLLAGMFYGLADLKKIVV